MVFIDILIGSVGAAILFLCVVFAAAIWLKRVDLIDSFWGPVFVVIALEAALQVGSLNLASSVTILLVTVWALRLFWHIFRRFLASPEQDPRYNELMKKWPKKYLNLQVFARVYVIQALLAGLVSIPVVAIVASQSYSTTFLALGVVVWAVGFIFESVSDAQLKHFIQNKDNQGKLMQTGLWRYSRHPNYFGELLQWWGIALIAVGSAWPIIGFAGPLVLTLLICFVSGVPPAERRASSKPGWADYKRRTSVLAPLPPKN
ncbi:MAG TPA: DUF1295 domain-containing protein [Candidatus Saccharibacteria bacterium]|nr:DUF1295 domain-containing protein [Candidatus Saccharibacteria bacterium]